MMIDLDSAAGESEKKRKSEETGFPLEEVWSEHLEMVPEYRAHLFIQAAYLQ